jgi:hypothetical protein
MSKKKSPPSIGQFALSERDDLLAKITKQAREIAAMKAQPGAVVLPELIKRAADVVEGLHGEPLPGAMPVRVQKLKAALESLNASRVPGGWKLVPVEPTLNMLGAALMNQVDCVDTIQVIRADYKAMLSAAPAPAVEPAHSDVSVPREVLRFLLGESDLHGVAFGDARPPLGKFWWRTELRALLGGEV